MSNSNTFMKIRVISKYILLNCGRTVLYYANSEIREVLIAKGAKQQSHGQFSQCVRALFKIK